MFQLVDSKSNRVLGEAQTVDSACQMLMHFQQNMPGADIRIIEVPGGRNIPHSGPQHR